MQQNLVVNNSAYTMTGTVKYLSSGYLVDTYGAGNFIALKFNNIPDDATSVKVGINTPDTEIITNPDKNGAFKIGDNDTDKFIVDENYLVSYSSYMTYIDNLTNDYIAFLGMNIRTRYGYDKIRESILEIFKDITVPEKHGKNIRFKYNKMPEQDSASIINRRSVDILIEKMFAVTNDVISSSKLKLRENHIILEPQKF
jgi:hypothetical protein